MDWSLLYQRSRGARTWSSLRRALRRRVLHDRTIVIISVIWLALMLVLLALDVLTTGQ